MENVAILQETATKRNLLSRDRSGAAILGVQSTVMRHAEENPRTETNQNCTQADVVDCGATSHIRTEMNKFTRFDETFNPKSHYMELADGTRMNNVELK